MDSHYEAMRFESRVLRALENVKAVLDNTRNPMLPKDVAHSYDNKYFNPNNPDP
jgi:hypothetical protein